MKVIQSPAFRFTSLDQLQEKTARYLANCINPSLTPDLDEYAHRIFDKLVSIITRPYITTSTLRGICMCTKQEFSELNLMYGTYLHACSLILGYADWRSLMGSVNKSDVVENLHHGYFNIDKTVSQEVYVPRNRGLASLSKGRHVNWVELQELLKKFSDKHEHRHIDALLMEMQLAVGITAASDERGDMLFAVFKGEEEDTYTILGEKYRPPNERTGSYLTIMVIVKTYPMSNRIASVSTPKGNCLSPVTIKQRVEQLRAEKLNQPKENSHVRSTAIQAS